MFLLPPAKRFLERVEFDGDENGVVARLRPSGSRSQVMIDPEVRFGSPTVQGIPTETIAEQVAAGDSVASVARDFDLDLTTVIDALRFEGVDRAHAASGHGRADPLPHGRSSARDTGGLSVPNALRPY